MISELKLLKGSAIYVGNIGVYPVTIGEITDDIGEDEYFQYLNVISIDKSEIGVKDGVRNIDLVVALYFENPKYAKGKFRDYFMDAMKIFLRNEVVLYGNDYSMYFGVHEENVCHIIDARNFDEIINIVKTQNCVAKIKEQEDNPANQITKDILEKQKRARELVARAKKQNSDEPLVLADLVSILIANGNGIDPFNVWDMNIYMFNNQFNRMKMLEDYDISIRSLLAGAKSEDVDLKSWMRKIE